MTREFQALLALVRAGLWERYDEAMASFFPLSAECWERVFVMARQQTVTGIAFRGLDYLPEESMPPMGLMARWMAYVDRIEQGSRRVNETVAMLYNHFAISGEKAVLQKGAGVASMYPEPLLREYGDIDLFFPEHDGKSDPLAGIPGAVRTAKPDDSWEYNIGGVIIEHHSHLVDIQAPRSKRFVRQLIAEKGFETIRIDGCDVLVPAPEVNLLLLSSHILKHALGVGIGLRQLCDMAAASRCYADRVDKVEMEAIYRKVGLKKWSEVLDFFMSEHLGVSIGRNDRQNSKNYVEISNILLDIVLKGGNFGHFTDKIKLTSRNKMSRKLHTFASFWGRFSFALNCAIREWFWTMVQLIGGQMR